MQKTIRKSPGLSDGNEVSILNSFITERVIVLHDRICRNQFKIAMMQCASLNSYVRKNVNRFLLPTYFK